jgi:hypothetical protein
MSEAVDELFGEEGSAAGPRVRTILALLGTGLVLSLLGMACTAVPGGLVVLVAWSMVEKDLDRVDSGYLALEHRPTLSAVRRAVYAGLVLVVLLFLAQTVLLCTGVYYDLWSAGVEMLRPVALPEGVGPVTP